MANYEIQLQVQGSGSGEITQEVTGMAGGGGSASARDAEAWARGTRGGVDVTSTDPTYHNNSKYYSEQAGSSAAAAETAKEYAQTFTGAPRAAAAAADMTDEDLIYVYTGTTGGGLTNGHWYYWDGEAWTSGGVYNSTALTTDTTLTVAGAAADSKKVGDEFSSLKSAIGTIPEGENVEGQIDDLEVSKADRIIVEDNTPASVMSFPDGANNAPVTELKVAVEPVQNLHGYDNPWPAWGGKNLLGFEIPNGSYTHDGITVTQKDDGSIVLNGTSESQFAWNRMTGCNTFAINKLTAGVTYTLSGSANKPQSQSYIQLIYTDDVTGSVISIVTQNASPVSITPTNDATFSDAYCTVASGVTFNNETLSPQLEIGSSATTYAPYSNICPISGWTGAKVVRTAKNIADITGAWTNEKSATVVSNDGTNIVVKSTSSDTWTRCYTVLDKNLFAGRTITLSYKVTGNSNSRGFVGGSCYIYYYVGNTRYEIGVAANAQNTRVYATGTIPANVDSLSLYLWATLGALGNADETVTYSELQIEYGSQATAFEKYVDNSDCYNISFPSEAGTVYGGTLTINKDGTGTLVVKRVKATGLSWVFNDGSSAFTTNSLSSVIKKPASNSDVANVICENYKTVSTSDGYNSSEFVCFCNVNGAFYIRTGNSTDTPSGDIVYELATPVTYTFTAEQIRTLLGVNNIWADTGDINSIQYPADTRLYIDKKFAELQALILENISNT